MPGVTSATPCRFCRLARRTSPSRKLETRRRDGMAIKVQVIFYSMYGHVYKMAQAVVEGLTHMGDITGGTPYGATTLAGPDGSRQPTENELKIARYQGKHVTEIAGKLFR